jgi:hypothetical protein
MRIGIVVRSDFVQLASKPHYHLFDKRESPSRIFKVRLKSFGKPGESQPLPKSSSDSIVVENFT